MIKRIYVGKNKTIFGEEVYCATMKKNKLDVDVQIVSEFLINKNLIVHGIAVDKGKTSNGYDFFTWRFYVKNKE